MIKLEITANNAPEFHNILSGILQNLNQATSTAAPAEAPAPTATATAASAPAERKTRTSKKSDAAPAEGAASADTSVDTAEQNVDFSESETTEEATTEEPAEDAAPEIALTLDNVRKFAVDYVTDKEPKDQAKRKEVFSAILAEFGSRAGKTFAKFSDIPESAFADVVTYIKDARKAAGLPDAEVAAG